WSRETEILLPYSHAGRHRLRRFKWQRQPQLNSLPRRRPCSQSTWPSTRHLTKAPASPRPPNRSILSPLLRGKPKPLPYTSWLTSNTGFSGPYNVNLRRGPKGKASMTLARGCRVLAGSATRVGGGSEPVIALTLSNGGWHDFAAYP